MVKSKLNDGCNEANNHQPVEVTFDPLEILDQATNQTKATSVPVVTTEKPKSTHSKPTITTAKPYSKNDPQKDDISNTQIIKTNPKISTIDFCLRQNKMFNKIKKTKCI